MTYRAAATSIANWAEEQGGIPLFTIEGSGMSQQSSDAFCHAVFPIHKLTGWPVLQAKSLTHPQQAGTSPP